MPKKQQTEKKHLLPLPDADSAGYFRALVRNCVTAYERLSNDSLALDYCKVSDRKLRAMILDDGEYRAETRNIFARQRLEEVEELENIASRAADDGDDEDDGEDDSGKPWNRGGKGGKKKASGTDKDMLNMRFKAAQMKRELRAELAAIQGDHERDAVNLMYVPVTQEELDRLETVELHRGTDDADIDALIGVKEDVPIGTRETMTAKSRTEVPEDDPPFEIMPDGTVVEK